MARTTPDAAHAELERWKNQDVLRCANYMDQAFNHALGRNGRVVTVLSYLSVMRGAGRFAGLPPVDADPSTPDTGDEVTEVLKAEFQNFKSPDGKQAAHYLPGQLKINGRNPSTYTADPAARTALDTIFADVEELPANYNKADSQAEKDGLCAAFAAAAAAVIAEPSTAPAGRIDRALVTRIYRTVWVPRSHVAYQLALVAKGEKYTMPDVRYSTDPFEYRMIVNLEERTNLSVYQWAITVQRYILEHYIRALATEPRELGAAAMAEVEASFRP